MCIGTELKDYVEEKENEVMASAAAAREHADVVDGRVADFRDDADKDYARVLYSSAFRRLQDKMQLFIPHQSRFHRNRLTHSLEVAQIARSIAKRLKLKDILTVQTCSLAHDIGNPPFGHYGETILDELCKAHGDAGFEGNAQTFRVLTNIEEKHFAHRGLNLTWRTLFGVVKYPNDNSDPADKDKYLYKNDWEDVEKAAKKHNVTIGNIDGKKIRTIDAEIMDIADEIAYAAHDLQDALKQGYFSIDELMHEFSMSERYMAAHNDFKMCVHEAREFAGQARAYGTSEEYSSLFLRELTSVIVNKLVLDVGLKDGVLDYCNHAQLAEGLKKLTYHAVGRKRDIKQYELMGEKVLRELFMVYADTKYNKNGKLLPMDYVEGSTIKFNKDGSPQSRSKKQFIAIIADYMSGMMDSFAIEQHKIYFGESELKRIYFT